MAVYNSHNTKQWEELLNAINGGDTSAITTALTDIKTSIDTINTSLLNLSAEIDVNSTQWVDLINAITNQSLNVDLSNITSSIVSNLSIISATNVTNALNILANKTNIFNTINSPLDVKEGFNLIFIPTGTVIGTMSMPNNMRGFALRNNNVLFAIVSSFDGSVRYTIHSDRGTFDINPRSF